MTSNRDKAKAVVGIVSIMAGTFSAAVAGTLDKQTPRPAAAATFIGATGGSSIAGVSIHLYPSAILPVSYEGPAVVERKSTAPGNAKSTGS